MRRLLVALGGLSLAGLLVLGGALLWAVAQFEAPGRFTADTTVLIPRGTGIGGIAARLHEAGVLDHPVVFEWATRWFAARQPLQAGEYRFTAGMSPRAVMEKMMRGETEKRRLTVAEGLTTPEVLDLVRHADGLDGELSPQTLALPEGRLLPETYFYSWGDSRDGLVQRMAQAMDRLLAEAWPHRADGLAITTPQEAVILASIVEKETAVPEERPRIARVFMNRLERGMRLQSDPTVIYALTQGKTALGRPLSRADLAVDSPYNTYEHYGLPPGPIANPGRDSILAVLQPAAGNDLYFVADGTGRHAFAETLAEHNRNVAALRRLEASRPPASVPDKE
ncbi:MAG: endolytic transglycosylase MltG [Rhodospirillaceae bacterium]|nr:endolytic transglycosylase MltG [Rhodospirillaceae bacterium]